MRDNHFKCTFCLSIFVLLLVVCMGLDSYARFGMSQAHAIVPTEPRTGSRLQAQRLNASFWKRDTSGLNGVIFEAREYVKVLR